MDISEFEKVRGTNEIMNVRGFLFKNRSDKLTVKLYYGEMLIALIIQCLETEWKSCSKRID